MKKQQSKASEEGKKVDRRALVAYEEKVKDLKIRVDKLEHIVNANRKEKAMYKGAMRKLQRKRKTEFQELVQKLVYFIEIIENNDYNKYL